MNNESSNHSTDKTDKIDSNQVAQWKNEVMNLERELCNPPLLIDQSGCKVPNPPEYIKHHQEDITELKKKINNAEKYHS